MLQLQHFLPKGHPRIVPDNPERLKELMPYLHTRMADGWTAIPDSKLEIFFTLKYGAPCLAFRKDKKEVFIHIFCFESYELLRSLDIVDKLYAKYRLGTVEFPEQSNWIHTIPIPGSKVTEEEKILVYQITQSFFWTLFLDFKKNVKGDLN